MQLPAAAGQFGVRAADLFLGEFLRRDVPENTLQTDDASVRAVQGRFDDLNDGSLLSQRLMFLDDFVGLGGFDHAAVVLLVLFSQFLREKIEIRFAEDVLQPAFVMFAILLIGECEASLQVLPKNVLRHRLHQRMIKGFRIPQFLLHLPAPRDVHNRAFVVKQLALRVAHGAAVFGNPDDNPVLAVNEGLEPLQRVMFPHQPDEFLAPPRLHVQPLPDVLDARHQFHRRVVTVNVRQRHVRQQIMAVGRRAENAFDEMVKNAVVIVLFLDQREPLVLALNRAADGAPQAGGVEVFPGDIILRAIADDFGGEDFIVRRSEHQDRQAWHLGGERGDLGQSGRVGGGQFKQNGVK